MSALVARVDREVNSITKRQLAAIYIIEQNTSHKFEEYSNSKRGANDFIEEYSQEAHENFRKKYSDAREEMSPADYKLFSRGISRDDIMTLRLIEQLTGLDFSTHRQIKSEVYAFIEENKSVIEEKGE